MTGTDKAAAIRVKAERLAGRSLGENGDALTEMAMERACAWCGREDIPEAMEQAVAALLLDMEGREAAVKSVTRGDTAVTYAVADSDGHVTTKTRTVIYTDYVSPRFSLTKALRYAPGEAMQVRDRLRATDTLDGDLSDSVKVTSTALSSSVEGTYPVTFEVVNSLGDAVSLTLDVEIHARTADEPRITLSQYIVYLNEGETFSPLQYLSDVSGGSAGAVRVSLPDGGLQPGLNKVSYACSNGSATGTATLYVVVG
mgnify:CR=1 FL=1